MCWCGKNFSRKFGLNRHKREVHGIDNGVEKGGMRRKAKAEGMVEKTQKDMVVSEQAMSEQTVSDFRTVEKIGSDPASLTHAVSDFDKTFSNPDWTAADAYGMPNADAAFKVIYQPARPVKWRKPFEQTKDISNIKQTMNPEPYSRSDQGASSFSFNSAPLTANHDPTDTLQSQPDSGPDSGVDTSCVYCYVDFGDLNAVVVHYHTHHGLPISPSCACEICTGLFQPPDDVPADIDPTPSGHSIDNPPSGIDFDDEILYAHLDAWLQNARDTDEIGH